MIWRSLWIPSQDAHLVKLFIFNKPSNEFCFLLSTHFRNRFDYLSHVRKLTEDDWKDDVDKASEEEEIMDIEQTIKKPGRHYQDQVCTDLVFEI